MTEGNSWQGLWPLWTTPDVLREQYWPADTFDAMKEFRRYIGCLLFVGWHSGCLPQPEPLPPQSSTPQAKSGESSSYPKPAPDDLQPDALSRTSELAEDEERSGVDQVSEDAQHCIGREFTQSGDVGWDNFQHYILTKFSPYHRARDRLLTVGGSTRLHAKFTYGMLHVDLSHELVDVYVDTCREVLEKVTTLRTDTDGVAEAEFHADHLTAGIYQVYFHVLGDNSLATAHVQISTAGTPLVVFDVDGTLTSSDPQIVKDVLPVSADPKPRPNGPDVTRFWIARGHAIAYLTGRPYELIPATRRWLEKFNAGLGTLHGAQSFVQSLPVNTEEFKYQQIKRWADMGFEIVVAYGNTASDVAAYRRHEIERIYIIGKHRGGAGTVHLGHDFVGHLEELHVQGSIDR